MLGPVMMQTWFSPLSIRVSLGTKRVDFSIFSTTGWRPSVISILSERSTWGMQYWLAAATAAKEVSTSRQATAWAERWISRTRPAVSSRTWVKSSYSRATILSWADRIVCSMSLSSWVM